MSSENINKSMSLTPPASLSWLEKLGLTMIGMALLAMMVAFLGNNQKPVMPFLFGFGSLVTAGVLLSVSHSRYKHFSIGLFLFGILALALLFIRTAFLPEVIYGLLFYGLLTAGSLIYIFRFYNRSTGIDNDGYYHHAGTNGRGYLAWLMAIVLTGFYILLYWIPSTLHGLLAITDPLSQAMFGIKTISWNEAGEIQYNQWFMYGLFYTLAVMIMGIRYIIKYRHNRYQVIRTLSVMFFQVVSAFILANLFQVWFGYGVNLHTFWPLDFYALWPGKISDLWNLGDFGQFAFIWLTIGAFVAVPVLTYYFGKRWYCSWVCGCGGLAETAGDPYRHLSDKSLRAWRIERVLIHSVLVAITVVTALLLIDFKIVDFMDDGTAWYVKQGYGFVIGSIFAGVIGVGFYPIMGSRVWCRFGCPQAAILGILQKWFSRFRITTNGGQCISCGNCSTYCEMGIDVKWYAQRGQNIVRASCVGCGVCSAVCPRGVLKLENGPIHHKAVFTIDHDEVRVLS